MYIECCSLAAAFIGGSVDLSTEHGLRPARALRPLEGEFLECHFKASGAGTLPGTKAETPKGALWASFHVPAIWPEDGLAVP